MGEWRGFVFVRLVGTEDGEMTHVEIAEELRKIFVLAVYRRDS